MCPACSVAARSRITRSAVEQLAVAVTQPMQQARRSLDVGEQHRHEASRQMDRFAAPSELTFGLQLTGDEPDGDDAESLGRLQQPASSEVSRRLVLENDLVEAGESIADVGRVVDRQPSPPTAVDVREGAGGKLGPISRFEPCHVVADY